MAKKLKSEKPLLSDETLAKIRINSAKNGNILTGGLSQGLPTKNIKAIAEKVKSAPENIRILWNLAQADMKILDAAYLKTPRYLIDERGIKFNLNLDITSKVQKPYRTLFHETGHFVDNWLEKFSGYRSVKFKDGIFIQTLKLEAAEYIKAKMTANKNKKIEEICNDIIKELLLLPVLEQREVSDIWHGVTNGKIHGDYGHNGKDYWTQNQGENIPKEAFAHMFCATLQNPESLIQIKKYFPKSYGIFEEIINDFLKGVKTNDG